MATRVYEAFYLGNFTSLDPTEGTSNTISENASLLVGRTFGGTTKPNQLYRKIVNLTLNDANNNGTVTEDPSSQAEPISYNLGAGTITSPLDSSQSYTATITYAAGSGLAPATVTLVVIQDNLGNLFVIPPTTTGATATALGAGRVASITFNTLVNANSTGVTLNRVAVNLLCFATGTLISTENGDVAIEQLKPGIRVATKDHGFQPLRLLASRRVAAIGAYAPVVFAPGAIGNLRELRVTPQHRILSEGYWSELLFGEDAVLVPAISFVNGRTVSRREGGMIEYFHMVFDQHEIVFAEGAQAESLYVCAQSLLSMADDLQTQIRAIFPDCRTWNSRDHGVARPCLTKAEGRLLTVLSEVPTAPALAEAC